jgi:CBS domain-containing protein
LVVTLQIKDVMDKNVAAVNSGSTVSEAIKKMLQSGVWSLVVQKRGLPEGVVTERDILRRCIGKGLLPEKVKIEEIMTSPLVTIGPNATIGEAMRLMIERNVRRLFIVEGGKITGRITQTRLFETTLNVMTDLTNLATQL